MKIACSNYVGSVTFAFITALFVSLSALDGGAATAVWFGSTLPGGGLWSNPRNWQNNYIPHEGDDIEFAFAGSWPLTTNDLAIGMRFRSLRFARNLYTLSGNPIGLTHGIINEDDTEPPVTINLTILLDAAQTFDCPNKGARIVFGGDGLIFTAATELTFAGAGTIEVDARISGNGAVTKTGTGRLRLLHDNTFEGPMAIHMGVVELLHSQGLGSTTGDTLVDGQGTLELSGGIAIAAGEALTLGTDGTVDALRAMTGSNLWAGPIVLSEPGARIAVMTSVTLSLSGAVSGTDPHNGIVKTNGGHLWFIGSTGNTYTGPTLVSGGELRLNRPGSPVILGDLTIGHTSRIVPLQRLAVREFGSGQISGASQVLVRDTGLLDISGINGNTDEIGSLAGSGLVTLGLARLRCGIDGRNTVFSGRIEGDGGLSKAGSSTLILSGDNGYTGATRVGGTGSQLVVNGQQPNSPVEVNAGGTLSGSGRVGAITSTGGTIAPGDPIGTLTCGGLTLDSASALAVDLNGTGAGQFDQLVVSGTCELNGARLLPQPLPYVMQTGDQFLIINNDGADAVVNRFASGNSVQAPNVVLAIDYAANGNDVRLTVSGMPLASPSLPTVLAGNGNGRFDPDECNDLRIRLRNDRFAGQTIQGISAHLETDHPHVYITQADSTYPPIAHVNEDPDGDVNDILFQVSAFPSLRCGDSIRFRLLVTTTSHGSFIIETFVNVGLAGICAPGTGMCALCPADFTINGSLPAFNGTLLGPDYDVVARSALCSQPVPLTCNPNEQAAYESYLFENSGPRACIQVRLQALCTLISGTILNPQSDKLDGCPAAIAGTVPVVLGETYFVDVPAFSRFLVFVQAPALSESTDCAGAAFTYTLTVSGGHCQVRIADVRTAGTQNRVTYSTLAGGYEVQRAANLGGPWTTLPHAQRVEKSSYILTTTPAGPNEFYRLMKPD